MLREIKPWRMASRRIYVALLAATAAIGISASLAPGASASSAQVKLKSARQLTLGPDGRVWFFARSNSAKVRSLYAANAAGSATKFRLRGSTRKSAKAGVIGRGADGKLWVSFSGVPREGRTSIFRIGKNGKVSVLELPGGRVVKSIASDPNGRTWFLGYSQRRVGYFDSKLRLHSVIVPRANELESLVSGADGRMWASSRKRVTAFDSNGRSQTVATPSQPTPGISSGGGSVWVAGVESIQSVSARGELSQVRLPFPTFDRDGIGRFGFTYGSSRIVYSVFNRPGAQVGFTSGASVTDGIDRLTVVPSFGGTGASGPFEIDPASKGIPHWPDNANTGSSLYPTRRPEAKFSVADNGGHLWAATDYSVVILPLDQ